MKHGDLEFHQQTATLIDAICREGLRIAQENGWDSLVIDIVADPARCHHPSRGIRCSLRNAGLEPEIDEPTAALLDAAKNLQQIFAGVGTPLAGAIIDWIDQGTGRQRRCRYRYD